MAFVLLAHIIKRRLPAIVLAAGAVTLLGGIAHAGYKSSIPVWVSSDHLSAEGAVGTARNSGNSVEYIRCQTWAMGTVNDGSGIIECYARTAAGLEAYCIAQDSNSWPLGAISMISDSPYLSFTIDNSGHCLSIGSSVASSAMPKRP